jgi:hypothetical protein
MSIDNNSFIILNFVYIFFNIFLPKNQQFAKGQLLSQDNLDENDDYQSRIIGSFGQQQQNNARFFFNSNPFNFGGMSAPVVMSMVTTIASIVTCVPSINFEVLPPPACSGRKRRNSNDAEDTKQFLIFPSKTLKYVSYIEN